ncbi:sensor histidine kinase [Dokdonia pacifica]|uniref:histidine kinase n=1 Tax=Dokdonia pacifica TaxID=1627892 RepID=A0A238VWW7_9FLAO|nr:HAMP domain-containing sensor histidine kinase [Dokdonia pacifica]SNR38786.1 Signal transduction histidine kinase [Dokdonia pacifica]
MLHFFRRSVIYSLNYGIYAFAKAYKLISIIDHVYKSYLYRVKLIVLKRSIHWYLCAFLIFIGGVVVYLLHQSNLEKEEISNRQQLEYIHNRAVNQFSSSIHNLAGLIAGMKSYINMSEEMPSQEQFQKFVQSQLNDIDSKDSIVISVIDTSHIFRQAFTRYENDPAQLIGRSVKDIRSKDKIEALESLMKTDHLLMFPPINLREGWLGIPINFRIKRNGIVEGYGAPILNFATIMSSVYDDEITKDFVFKFSTERGYEFDRTRSYNETEVYTKEVDKEFYKNYNIPEDAFISTTTQYFGFEITIATAYKEVPNQGKRFRNILLLYYGLLILVLLIITWQLDRYRKLNNRLEIANTEIASQNEELQHLNQTKNRFFTMISHDVKQPLQSVEGLLDLLQDEKTDDPSINSLFKKIRKSTRNTVDLLNNLLRWALSQTGELSYTPVRFNVAAIIQKTIALVDQQALSKQITIVQELDDTIHFYGDVDMIQTVVRNLTSNAIKFTKLNGVVLIQSYTKDQHIYIVIKDNGVGMKPELASSLFQIGEMVSREGTQGETGTGLGLILCKEFIERHQGEITVSSELDKGTTFTIILPAGA